MLQSSGNILNYFEIFNLSAHLRSRNLILSKVNFCQSLGRQVKLRPFPVPIMSCDDKDPPKPEKHLDDKCKPKTKVEIASPCESTDKTKKLESKPKPATDPCEKFYPSKGLEQVFKKKHEVAKSKPVEASAETKTKTKTKIPPPICPSSKADEPVKKVDALKSKIKLPSALANKIKLPDALANKVKLPTDLINNIKDKLPEVDLKGLRNIEYAKLIQYGFCKLNIWIRDNCNPKKMADKGSGAPARPMKYPYTFSAKFAQFPMGHYVKNQWIWKYYVFAFAACVPIFYSINKLSNSPGNVAKWAEIRRKEAAEHHH